MNKLHSDLIKPEMFRQNPDRDHAMSIFLYRAVVAKSGFGQTGPKSEMQVEQDMFETMGVHLARKTRREGDACVVAQSAAAEDRTWLATVLIEPLDDGATQAQLLVPAGVHLASGLFVGVKDRSLRTELIDCDAMSCRASVQLNSADPTGWKKAREAEVRYRPNLGGPVISFPLSLMGLTAAFRSLEGPQ